jgi:hypothetical protein
MQRLIESGREIGEKTLQRRLKEAMEWGELISPLKGYYAPAQSRE